MTYGRSLFGKLGLLCTLFLVAVNASAFSLTISKSQIDGVLSLTFPYETKVGANTILLSDPQPLFYAPSQEMGITLKISIKESNAIANATLRGGIAFDNKQQQLQLVKPKVAALEWLKKPSNVNQAMISQVEQWVGQDLPIIVLLDIGQLTGNTFSPTLQDIKIQSTGIEVIF